MFEFQLMNAIFLLGTLMLIRQAIRDRRGLIGFSISGSVVTGTGMIVVEIMAYNLRDWVSLIFSFPTFIFWWMIVVSLIWCRRRKR